MLPISKLFLSSLLTFSDNILPSIFLYLCQLMCLPSYFFSTEGYFDSVHSLRTKVGILISGFALLSCTVPRVKAKVKLREKAHVTPHVAGETWAYVMESFWGAIENRPYHFLLYFSAGFDRNTKVTEINYFFKQTLGNHQWLDELPPPPGIRW
jgi:hypothetical protein